jgi:hypothetical protein
VARKRGVDENERGDPFRVREREVDDDPPAEGVPDDRGGADPDVVEERAEVVDVGERPAGQWRLSEAAEIRAEDEVPLGEDVRLRLPEPAVADPGVDEDDRESVPAQVVRELGAVERCDAQACASRNRCARARMKAQPTCG